LITDVKERYGAKYKIVGCDESSNLFPLTQAFFGQGEPGVIANLPHEPAKFLDATGELAPYFNELKVFSTSTWQTWQDLMSHGLSTFTSGGFPHSSTLVLIRNVQDLAHFWNLRTATEPSVPASVLPIPYFEGKPTELVELVADLLSVSYPGFFGGDRGANLVSKSVPTDELNALAEQVNEELKKFESPQISAVHVPVNHRESIVVPYESNPAITGELKDNHLKWFPPQPRMIEHLANSDCWYVDILKDISTRRSVAQLAPVRRHAAFEVLNAPSPLATTTYAVPSIGFGFDSINFRCSKNSTRRTDCLPSAEELIHTILIDADFRIAQDEKRKAYETALGLFPGSSFRYAAEILTGKRGEILNLLATENQTLDGIQSKLRLGKGKLQELVRPNHFNQYLNSLPNHAARVSQARAKTWYDEKFPADNRLKSLLELWADKKFVNRIWKIGPCKSCNHFLWEREFSLAAQELCSACGTKFEFNSRVPYGYELNPAFAHSIREGAAPVFQTGRFFDNLCNHGFLWVPGVKYSRNEENGDIDLAAICDGQLVLCECKDLCGTEMDTGVWEKVERQMLELIKVGIELHANLVVLATRSNGIPAALKTKAVEAANGKLSVAFLTKSELESGWRKLKGEAIHSLDNFVRHCPTSFDQSEEIEDEA
jgi:hypothetical protein